MVETLGGAISPERRSALPLVLTLAAILTGLNALKPLHVDDATFYFNAAQIAAHPLDPYGYTMMRFDEPVPVLTALAPPVLPAWWAGAIRLFGPQPVLWKLWLFPFALLFVGSNAALLRRFAAPVAAPLLTLLVLSPVFLPSLNLMMDIPAHALALTALVLFLRACDENSPPRAVLAGLTAGLAMQTKYTAFLIVPVLLVYALLHRKTVLGLGTATTAALVFAAWEMALVLQYGQSHFYYQVMQGENGDQPKSVLIGALCPILGGVVPTLALLALTILRVSGRWLLLAAVLTLFPLVFVWTDWTDLSLFGSQVPPLGYSLFACVGATVLLCMAAAAWRLVRPSRAESSVSPFSPRGSLAWFLVLWFGLELAGYVAISPFPAVRRVMGITVAATLLLGHLASQAPLEPWRRNVLRGLAGVTAFLGLGFFAVDYLEAWTEQQAVYQAAQRIREQHPHAVIWYAGYWGFQFYAEQVGMKQAVPPHRPANGTRADLPPSRFRPGDWLVLPSPDVPQQELHLDRQRVKWMDEIVVADSVPLSTLIWYYAGSPPLYHHHGPRLVVRLFRFF